MTPEITSRGSRSRRLKRSEAAPGVLEFMNKTGPVLDAAERPEGLKPCDALALVLFGVTLLGTGLGSVRVLTYHEANFADPAREVVMTGDWVVPRT
ncbi:MAG: hypothetical protein IIA65_02675, partial [Planctomycetes bacterium]|nr:hypothetical protein [Planctomycetota bacterium]